MTTYLLGDLSASSVGLPMADHVLLQRQGRARYVRRGSRRERASRRDRASRRGRR